MERVFTEQDWKEISQAEIEMAAAGYDYVTQEGGNRNAKLVMDYLNANLTVPATRAEIYKFVAANRSLFAARTAMQQKWDAVVKTSGRTPEELNQFHALMQSTGKSARLSLQSEDYWYNSALLLAQLQGRVIDSQQLIAAIGRLAPGSQGSKFGPKEHLIFTSVEQVPVDPRKGIHIASENYKSGQLFNKDEVNQTDINRFRGQTEEQPAPAPQEQKEQSAWSRINDQICANGSHGQQAALREIRARALAQNNGSERLANAALEAEFRAIFKKAPTPVTPFEAIARTGRT